MASPRRPERPDGEPAVAAIEAELEDARERVAESMSTLGDEIARRTDWRSHVREHPLLALGIALGGGYALGGGLFTPATARLLKGAGRLAIQLAVLPAVEREVAGLAARVGESLQGGLHAGKTAEPDEAQYEYEGQNEGQDDGEGVGS